MVMFHLMTMKILPLFPAKFGSFYRLLNISVYGKPPALSRKPGEICSLSKSKRTPEAYKLCRTYNCRYLILWKMGWRS